MTTMKRVLAAIGCGGVLICCGCGGNVAAPTAFVEHNAKDGSYLLQVPEGWEQADGGRGQYHHSVIKKGGAKIDITASEIGSILMGGFVSTDTFDPNADPDDPDAPDLSAVGEAHGLGLEKMLEDFPDLTATKAEKVYPNLAEGRRSEITYSGSFGATVRGYFATIGGSNKKVTVICTCSESNWEALKPAFAKAIDTLERGREESLLGG